MIQQIQDFVLWHDKRKEPNIQIKIMREIAINGKLTKPELRDGMYFFRDGKEQHYADTTIANIISTDEKSKIEKRLFWGNGSKKVNIKQVQYSLTNRAITILMLGHYTNNEDNRKLKIAEKPYLNSDEFKKFVSLFEKEHSYRFSNKRVRRFKHPLQPFISLYLSANPSMSNQLILESKNNPKIQELVSSIKSDEIKLEEINEKINEKIKEIEEKMKEIEENESSSKRNIEDKKNEIYKLLADTLIIPSKEK